MGCGVDILERQSRHDRGSYVAQHRCSLRLPPSASCGNLPCGHSQQYHDGWTYQGGALEQWFDQNWATQLATNTMWRLIAKTQTRCWRARASAHSLSGLQLRLASAGADATAQLAPYYLDWLAHPDYDAYWKQWSIEEHFSDIQVPALHIGGWYDIFLAGTLRNYMESRRTAVRTSTQGQRLLVQIGGHAGFGAASETSNSGTTRSDFRPRRSCLPGTTISSRACRTSLQRCPCAFL